MRRSIAGLLVACIAASAGLPVLAVEIDLNGHTFTLPVGFSIELVAGPPLVDRPITAAFDEQGRLYVSDSSGSNDPVQQQLESRPHQILRLTDTDGDGRFDERTVFADRMMFPEGTMWHDGSLYVAAPPSIWKLTDTDGDGAADRREEWFQGRTLTGCANDLHGPYLGPDGWIYWCKGAFAEQTYERPGRPPLVTRASHIFRCRPDGSRLESVMTGGMDNPVDVVFTPTGERIFTTTFLVHPGGGLRDGLIHALYGGVYGKDHGVLAGHPRTGDLLPPLVHLGPAAPCGLVRCESTALGDGYRDNVLACSFNLRKVTRHELSEDGPALAATSEDFLVSDNLDFHPTDILEDADGSLLVCDTGGWYKLCCPTSQLWKPDVLGAIYRVRRTDAGAEEDPRGLLLDWEVIEPRELAARLADRRPAVRERATQALGKLGRAATSPVLTVAQDQDQPAEVRRQAVWALSRIDSNCARAAVRRMLADPDTTVRQAALHVISLWRSTYAKEELLATLDSGTAIERRLAAEALGRIGDEAHVPVLLAAATGELDRRFEHALIYALIEIGAPDATRAGLAAADPTTRRVALIALDQMEGGNLQPAEVVALLTDPQPAVKSAAEWIVRGHADWGDSLARYLRDRLLTAELSEAERAELEEQLVRFAASESVQDLLADALTQKWFVDPSRAVAMRAMARSQLKETPAAWLPALVEELNRSSQGALLAQAVATLRALPAVKEPPPELAEALARVARNESLDDGLRLAALAAAPPGSIALDAQLFDLISVRLPGDQPVELRTAAADAVARSRLAPEQLLQLAAAFATVGPLEIDRLLAAYEGLTDPTIGLALAAALQSSPALSALRPDAIRTRLEKCGPELAPSVQRLLAELNVDLEQQKAKIEELLTGISSGDVRRGQAVFHSAKASCIVCHAMGYVGGRTGPDLTRIGQIRQERDLLEAIVFPSASFVRSFEPVAVLTTDGLIHNGLVQEETAEEIVLSTGVNKTVRLARSEIEELRPSTVSVMPSGLDQQLSRQELIDLVVFLKAAK
jgi:putative membrane-bound dehydrogenase-like protein